MNPRRSFRRRLHATVTSRSTERVTTALPCRSREPFPNPVQTFARNTAPALAGLLLGPHSQSTGRTALAARREPPRFSRGPSPISDTHRVGSQVARLSSSRAIAVPQRGTNEEATAWPLSQPVAFRSGTARCRSVSASRTWKHRLTFLTPVRSLARLSSPIGKSAWTPSLACGSIWGLHAALSVRAPTLTEKPSRALERVELFPLRFFFPDARSPNDDRPRTLRC